MRRYSRRYKKEQRMVLTGPSCAGTISPGKAMLGIMPGHIYLPGRVGIVGATVTQGGSGWGANAHVPALKALPDFELKAICTAHADTAEASRAAFGAELACRQTERTGPHQEARADVDVS